jgi:uncharacterized protein Yka (UPF0111/DUF47 family)
VAPNPLTPDAVNQLLTELKSTVERGRALIEESERINARADAITRQLTDILKRQADAPAIGPKRRKKP